eukprot:15328699-Ditylum_brightwellii.AAC.1
MQKEKRVPVAPKVSAAVSTTTSESHETMVEAVRSSFATDTVDQLLHQPLSALLLDISACSKIWGYILPERDFCSLGAAS